VLTTEQRTHPNLAKLMAELATRTHYRGFACVVEHQRHGLHGRERIMVIVARGRGARLLLDERNAAGELERVAYPAIGMFFLYPDKLGRWWPAMWLGLEHALESCYMHITTPVDERPGPSGLG
jgi:hypothetical protein